MDYHNDQLPGPDRAGDEDGWNFNGFGVDMRGVEPSPTVIVGNQLPGDPRWEPGWNQNGFGEDMAGMAGTEPIPQANNMGVFSDDGQLRDDVSASAGYKTLGPWTSNTAGVGASDITPAFGQLENGAGQHGSSDGGPERGFDSMRGLVLGAGSGPMSSGEQDSGSTGDRGIGMFPASHSGGQSTDE